MEASNVQPAQVMRRADQLVVGDRIDAEYLPVIATPAEVIFVRVHEYRRERLVFVAFIQDDGFIDSTGYLADAEIRIVPAANPPGLDFSRADDEPDDPTPVSPARVPMHTGGMTEGGLVDETRATR